MSCCNTEKESLSNKYLATLKKHFDDVILEDLEQYRLLTLRDVCSKQNYDYVVYLSVKVSYGVNNGYYHARSDDEMLDGILKPIVDWVLLLKEDSKPKQLSLFGDDDELEQEPLSPSDGGDEGWDKHFRDCMGVRKRNLAKEHSFFELCDLDNSWYCYSDNAFAKFLPQNEDEMIEHIRDNINEAFNTDSDKYLRDSKLSDIELFEKVRCSLRLGILPYERHTKFSIDDSYSLHTYHQYETCRFDFNYLKMSGSWNYNELPVYNLYRDDFLQMMRKHFNCEFVGPVSDDEVLKINIKGIFNYILRDSKISMKEMIDSSCNVKEFKKTLINYNGNTTFNSSGISIDGFRSDFEFGKKLSLKVTQDVEKRERIGRGIDGFRADYRDNILVIWELNGDEIYQKAFELFKEVESTLFDFAA